MGPNNTVEWVTQPQANITIDGTANEINVSESPTDTWTISLANPVNSLVVESLTVGNNPNEYVMPTAKGTANQVLKWIHQVTI